jgi:hypothetical protein
MIAQRNIGRSGFREMRSGGGAGRRYFETPASVSRETLTAASGSLAGGSFCAAPGTFFRHF